MKLTTEQLQEQLKDRQDQLRAYQLRVDAVREQINVILEQLRATETDGSPFPSEG